MNKMEKRANQSLINDYYFRIKAAGIEADKNNLISKLEKFQKQEIIDTMNTVLRGNEKDIMRTLKGIGVNAVSKGTLEKEVTRKLNLDSITEFENNGKSYFKFKDKEGNIRITRNMGDDSKALFMDILNNYNVASSDDQKKNSDEVFKFLTDYKFIEVNMKNSKNLSVDKIPKTSRAIIEEMQKKFPGKEIVYSLEQDIYVIKGEKNEKDQILNIKSLNGKISINRLEQKGYDDIESNKEKEATASNDMELDSTLENDEDLSKIVIDSEEQGITEDITIETVMNRIKEKYPEYSSRGDLKDISTNLIKKSKEKKKAKVNTLTKNNQF